MNRRWMGAIALVFALTSFGCGSRGKDDPILRLSAAEALTEGQRLMAEEKYSQARRYLQHAFEVEPNSVSGREALLRVADSLYLEGGRTNLMQAETKYRDFLNRFPTSDRAGYVQFQIANSLAQRLERPDRDQTATRQAVAAYQELLRLFPDSEHTDEAQAKIAELRERLAEHEYVVAYFYYRYGLPGATVRRLEHLLEQYPEYPHRPKVYYHLGAANRRIGNEEEARKWFDRLREEYPGSDLLADIPKPPATPARVEAVIEEEEG
jgi:outer membrane protein assembly factor BamD